MQDPTPSPVLVHTGFAIQRLIAEHAKETLRLLDELAPPVAVEGPARPGERSQ